MNYSRFILIIVEKLLAILLLSQYVTLFILFLVDPIFILLPQVLIFSFEIFSLDLDLLLNFLQFLFMLLLCQSQLSLALFLHLFKVTLVLLIEQLQLLLMFSDLFRNSLNILSFECFKFVGIFFFFVLNGELELINDGYL